MYSIIQEKATTCSSNLAVLSCNVHIIKQKKLDNNICFHFMSLANQIHLFFFFYFKHLRSFLGCLFWTDFESSSGSFLWTIIVYFITSFKSPNPFNYLINFIPSCLSLNLPAHQFILFQLIMYSIYEDDATYAVPDMAILEVLSCESQFAGSALHRSHLQVPVHILNHILFKFEITVTRLTEPIKS